MSLAFLCGTSLGGMITATALWMASGLLEPIEASVRTIFLICCVSALSILGARQRLDVLPQARRQVPQSILYGDKRVAAFGFGFALGTSMRTYVSTVAPYALSLGLLFLIPSGPTFIATGVAFGFGRWLTFVNAHKIFRFGKLRVVEDSIPVLVSSTCLICIAGLAFINQ